MDWRHPYRGFGALALMAVLAGGRLQASEAVPLPEHPTSDQPPAIPESASSIVEGEDGLEAEPIAPESDGAALSGLPGAASALAVRDHERALALTEGLAASVEPQTEAWYRLGAVRGRALLRLGRAEAAVGELEPRWSEGRRNRSFPTDVLGVELAKAKLQRAEGLAATEGDAQRREALAILDAVERADELRNLAEVRVLQAEALAAIEGTTPKATRLAARKAVSALQDIVSEYPNHPRVGDLWLALARALVRAGRASEGADELRRIYIYRAGEPEANVAWAALEQLATTERRVEAPPLSEAEELTRAEAARTLRRVELSREILDRLIDDPETSAARRKQALASRSWTAYKQRDYQRCADDVRPLWEQTGRYDARDHLLRCLERGEMYDEALAIWESQTKHKRRSTRNAARWEGVELAYRAGRYQTALDWLDAYEKYSKGHPVDRAWLRAWLPMRLGRYDDAIEAFREAERYGTHRTRARYFRGKLLLGHAEEVRRKEGEALLRDLARADELGYYGLQARQRLLDAGRKVPPPTPLAPVDGEGVHPTRVEIQRTFDELDGEFGDRWPSLRRARQLYAAGYLEEARRELRVTVEAYESRGRRSGGPRNESFYVGLGWRSEWTYPRLPPTKGGYRDLRDGDRREALRVGLRELSRGLDEPYRASILSTPEEGAWKARWQPRAYRWAVEREARLQRIEPVHMWSLMYTESRFRRFVVSPVGARGALQIMPWTARQLAERLGELENGRFDDDSLFDIDTNAHLAGYYVAELLRKFHGQAPPAYASYNGGPSNVARWLAAKSKAPDELDMDTFIEEMVFTESYRYTKRVMEVSAAYGLLYAGKLPRWSNRVDPIYEDNIDF